jgi:hypothetical protein
MSDKIDGLRTLPPDPSRVMPFPGVRPAPSLREGDVAHHGQLRDGSDTLTRRVCEQVDARLAP